MDAALREIANLDANAQIRPRRTARRRRQEPVRVMIAVARVRRMRRTGDHGRDACVPRVTMDGHPGLARSRDCAAQWSPRACAEQGLRSAMTHSEQIFAIVSRA